jgi:hypothetical protein
MVMTSVFKKNANLLAKIGENRLKLAQNAKNWQNRQKLEKITKH